MKLGLLCSKWLLSQHKILLLNLRPDWNHQRYAIRYFVLWFWRNYEISYFDASSCKAHHNHHHLSSKPCQSIWGRWLNAFYSWKQTSYSHLSLLNLVPECESSLRHTQIHATSVHVCELTTREAQGTDSPSLSHTHMHADTCFAKLDVWIYVRESTQESDSDNEERSKGTWDWMSLSLYLCSLSNMFWALNPT